MRLQEERFKFSIEWPMTCVFGTPDAVRTVTKNDSR